MFYGSQDSRDLKLSVRFVQTRVYFYTRHTNFVFDKHNTYAVFLSTFGMAPHLLLLSFLIRLLRESTIFQVFSQWNLYVKERSITTPSYVGFPMCYSVLFFHVMLGLKVESAELSFSLI